jgi:hypothetical protein
MTPKQQQQEKVLQIARMCMEVTALGKHSANFNYAGHCGLISVYIDDALTGYNAHARLEDDAKIGGIIAELQELGATPTPQPLDLQEVEPALQKAIADQKSVNSFASAYGHRQDTVRQLLLSGLNTPVRAFVKILYSLGFKITQ